MASKQDRRPSPKNRLPGNHQPVRGKMLGNILIVDDYAPGLWILSQILEDTAANITLAENGKEALELVKACGSRFDVILSDVNMPVMDGLTFFREAILYDPSLRSRFLFFTGSVSPEVECFFERNNLNYLEKPAGADSIIQAVAGAGYNRMTLERTF